jgi:hypothetical protein
MRVSFQLVRMHKDGFSVASGNGSLRNCNCSGFGLQPIVPRQANLICARDVKGLRPMIQQLVNPLGADAQARILFLAVFLGSSGVFLVTDIFWLLDRHKRSLDHTSVQQKLRFIVRLYCTLDLAILGGWGILLARSIRVSDFPISLRLLQVLSSIGATGMCVGVLNCYRSWSNYSLNIIAKLEETGIAVAFVLFNLLVGVMVLATLE